MDQSHSAQGARPDAVFPEIVENQLSPVSHDDLFDAATPIDDQADLAPNLRRQFRTGPREFRRDYLVYRDASSIEMLKPQELTGLQTMNIPKDSWNLNASVPCLTQMISS